MTTFKSVVRNTVGFICWIVVNPILYIGLLPILFMWQAIFHNVPVEMLIIDGVLAFALSLIFIRKLFDWTV